MMIVGCCVVRVSAAHKANDLTTKITMLHSLRTCFGLTQALRNFCRFFAGRASAFEGLCGLPSGLKRGGVGATSAPGFRSFRAKIIMGECCTFFGVTPPTQPPVTLRFSIYRSATGGRGFTSAKLLQKLRPFAAFAEHQPLH